MKFSKLLVVILFSVMCFSSYSQNLNLDGIISGYNYNPAKGIFKKGSKVLLEGHLNGVSILAFSNKKLIVKTKTGDNGEFHLELPLEKGYRIEVFKQNYGKIAFNIDLTKAQLDTDINFWSLELILNSYKYKKVDPEFPAFGILGYNSSGFYFEELKQKSNIFTQEVDYNPLVSLVLESIDKNKSNVFINKNITSEDDEELLVDDNYNYSTSIKKNENKSENHSVGVSPELIDSKAYNNLILSNSESSDIDLAGKELLIEQAKKQLEIDKLNAKTPLDSLLIAERETLIIAAENELVHLKEIIIQKENALKLKNNQLILFSIVLVLLIVMTFFILRANKIKSKLNIELEDKNKKISDSINYAVKIQSAILPSIDEIKKHLDSFILFKPKDKVSGDYYWFEEVDNKIIVAAIDCTGHGVPGAFMSMIGNVLMNTIILERKITSPKNILESLNLELQTALRQDNSDPFSSQDGMDLSICVIDKKNKKITYAGAMNSLFLLKKGKVEILEVTKRGVGGFDFFKGGTFSEECIDLEAGSQLYMLSDGFMDQFGGGTSEKYNLKRFKELLLKCESKSISAQESMFDLSFNEWKENEEQTDDILVIGINL